MPSLTSRSEFVRVRGLRYHLRRWGDPAKPLALLGHGWLDVSASFQDLVQPLLTVCQVAAPDWRGFGHTQWPTDGYWFPDYVADLDALVEHLCPAEQPLWLIGHSMGAQIMSLYAGLRPQRVSQLVLLDGLFLPDMAPELAPKRFGRWLNEWRELPRQKTYTSYEQLAERVRAKHPQLSAERALFIAQCWGERDGRGRIRLLADPKHRMNGPSLYRAAESMAIWQQISARTLFVDAANSPFPKMLTAEENERRRSCFAHRQATVIADAGHMLHFDAPQATGAAIAHYLQEAAV